MKTTRPAIKQKLLAGGQCIKQRSESLRRQLRLLLRPRSLTLQLALVAGTVALLAIIAIVLVSTYVVSSTFSNYLQKQLHFTAFEDAGRIGQIYSYTGDFPAAARSLFNGPASDRVKNSQGNEQIIIFDSSGQAYYPSTNYTLNNEDLSIIEPAIRQAMLTGIPDQGILPDHSTFFFHYSARAYAVAPIFDNSAPRPVVIGVISVFSDRTLGNITSGTGFIQNIDRTLVIGGLCTALIVAIIGALLARQITQPLERLRRTVARLRSGDLSARVTLELGEATLEIEQLTQGFNEMADHLEKDVNELRRQESQQRELVANVAHDLATPLTAIHGYAEALGDEDLTPQEREQAIRIIQQEAGRLQQLVNQLRQVAPLEAGIEEMDSAPLALAPHVSDTISVVQASIDDHPVTITNVIPADLPLVLVDANRLTQVMINLLDNAVRHTPPGGTITVTAEQQQNTVWVHVIDSGTGIPVEDLPYIFGRFYRSEKSRNRNHGGSGLGLAIVKGIIRAHGGQVRAANSPTGGADISFSLNLAPSVAPDIAPPTKPKRREKETARA